MSFTAFARISRVIPDLFVQALSLSASMHEEVLRHYKILEYFGKCPADMVTFLTILMTSHRFQIVPLLRTLERPCQRPHSALCTASNSTACQLKILSTADASVSKAAHGNTAHKQLMCKMCCRAASTACGGRAGRTWQRLLQNRCRQVRPHPVYAAPHKPDAHALAPIDIRSFRSYQLSAVASMLMVTFQVIWHSYNSFGRLGS